MKIYLVRHAEPDIDLKGWTNILEHRKLLRKYYRTGIVLNEDKLKKVMSIVGDSVTIYSSNLPRAILTAKAAFPDRNIIQEKVFREVELPAVRIPIKANYFLWKSISRIFWIIRLSKGENFVRIKNRIFTAADKLMKEAEQHDIVLFGHGIMNSLITLRLLSKGWKYRGSPINNYWNVIILKH
ncbi:hypothetical protein MNBD_IGNAVI01-1514 [hydrothermal vent metagenome]|uniref:Phosphoglycerate mutase family protein n=1 Tax=hydrothermal vent metagenome TaxID=652676 RepID=A0A3B1D281_9ZZZZ